jgi:dihydrolipoamide dehydrogenase
VSKSVLQCDVAVIGAGTAGLAAERSARRSGASTLLIDEAFSGTTCANVGCMPSKLLIAAAHIAHTIRRAPTFGIDAFPEINGAAVMARVQRERDAFAAATRAEIEKLPRGITVRGVARFAAEATLSLEDGRLVRARAIVIATGSRPSIPRAFGEIHDLVLTNENVFELPRLPNTLAVIGAGPLGLELAQAFARLGTDVSVFDEKDKLAAVEDPEITAKLRAVLEQEFDLHLGVKIEAKRAGDSASISWTGVSKGQATFDRVLIATGRPPDLTRLNLGATGLHLNDHGVPLFNRETMQCGESAIFMAGDADAQRPVLHEALAEGAIAGNNAATYPKVASTHRTVPFSIMFTDPPLATVGQQGDAALITGQSDYLDQGRAKVEARAKGVARLYATRDNATLKGALLFCPGADHLGHLIAWAIESGLDASTLLDRPFYHPTFEEGLKPALRQLCETAGAAPPSARDLGAPSGA